ncbi:glycosyltransferase family 2 protein [Boseongicola sp. H5]|uniref:glycosyltransferase family 2 protein n=1 Tax=Boseongicola sp. H5 TaxID=2763261 RepID=UPI001D0AF656|nr:glycosyltransferase family 2 protein [Boseongicola sp. H5]
MTFPLAAFDDFEIVSGPAQSHDGLPLLGILRNEMYFLPAFLKHYRSLGISQFILLNDASDDGSTTYLEAQPDVIQLRSRRRYGDKVPTPKGMPVHAAVGVVDHGPETRILYIWRSLLHARFALGRWALQVDLDEFIYLPEGMTLPDLVAQPALAEARQVLGVMLDAYPKDLTALVAQKTAAQLDTDAEWYFDGAPHLNMAAEPYPEILHPGARARLYLRYGAYARVPDIAPRKLRRLASRLRTTRLGLRIPVHNNLEKPVLLRWQDGDVHLNSHKTNVSPSRALLLLIVHYRFTGHLYAKIEMALSEASYSSGSRDHRFLQALIATMEQHGNASFCYAKSRALSGFSAFRETGNAIGLG